MIALFPSVSSRPCRVMMLRSRSCGSAIARDGSMTVGFEPLHREVHDREQQVLFALDVVVEPGLGQIDRRGDVAHRRGVEALLVKDLGRLDVDVDHAIRLAGQSGLFGEFHAHGLQSGNCGRGMSDACAATPVQIGRPTAKIGLRTNSTDHPVSKSETPAGVKPPGGCACWRGAGSFSGRGGAIMRLATLDG